MTKQRLPIFVCAALLFGLAAGVSIGAVWSWLATSNAALTCTAASEEFLEALSVALERKQCDRAKRFLNELLYSGSRLETYDPDAYAARIRHATRLLQDALSDEAPPL